MKTVIIDYGVGNIFSLMEAVKKIDPRVTLSGDPQTILSASHIILPGVGAFETAMTRLKEAGLDKVLHEAVFKGIPLLGICLGMQLLYEFSEENGLHEGLGLLRGRVKRFDEKNVDTIPHMGWNALTHIKPSPFEGINGYVYFVHSYIGSLDASQTYAISEYCGVEVPAIVGRDGLYGMQFHPEKSSEVGFKLLQGFLDEGGHAPC